MANIRNLKKDINYVLGDLIEAVYLVELTKQGRPTDETATLIEEALASFDQLMARVNEKGVEDKKAHFKQINADLENTAKQMITRINAM
ncbi:MAG: hypothetical protein CFE24_07975 [Flavobacterium sp. BFFFF2]|nr:MAG: hypothetical protein CFE24_07975 [Flavobacterium sp. BFFFF2]